MTRRDLQLTNVRKDIDSAAKFIGAGAATVGVAGSGSFHYFAVNNIKYYNNVFQALELVRFLAR